MSEPGTFAYRALRPDGTVETGTVEAGLARDAGASLAARGLLPVEVRLTETRREQRSAIPVADLALGLRMLADLLDSGLPISRALRTFEDLAPNAWRPALPHIRQQVKEGRTLAAALDSAPLEVPPLVIGITRAGEAGSGIGPAIRRAADAMEAAAATRAAVKAALVYPIILSIVGIGSIGMMVGVVLPRFAVMLADLNHTLPPATRLLLESVSVAKRALIPGVLAIVVLFVIWRAWVATAAGRARWHEWLLRVPVVGTVRRAAATARTVQSLAALLDSGVPIAEAMRHAARAGGDAALEERFLRSRDGITSGAAIASALEESGAVTTAVVRLVRAGEESGRLSAMLAHAGKLEQERSERMVKAAVRMLEPALVTMFATIVALVAAALLQAVYSVRPTA